MKIDIKGKEILDSFHFLSKIAKRNENIGKNLLIEADESVRLYAESSDIYGVSVISAGVIESGKYLLPISLIPYLQNLGDAQIELSVDLDRIKIKFGKSNINLAQISGRVGDFSKRKESPEWIGTDLAKLKNIKYASSQEFGYGGFWIMNNSIVASNRIKIAVYKPDNIPDNRLIIPSYITSYLPDGVIDLAIGKGNGVWFGSNNNNISIPSITDSTFPKPLDDLSADIDLSNFCMVNLNNLLQAATNAARVASDRHPGCLINVEDDIILVTASDTGDTNIHVNILDNSELKEKINLSVGAEYLKQILSNCIGPQIILGTRTFSNIKLLMINDYDVIHYLVPRSGG